jgi:hypothetical protein
MFQLKDCFIVIYQVEGVVKNLAAQGETEKVSALITVLINDFAMSPQANHRKVSPPKRCCNRVTAPAGFVQDLRKWVATGKMCI